MEILRSTIYYLEIVCLICALVTFKYYRKTPDIYIAYILVITCFIETLGFFNYHFPDSVFIKGVTYVFGVRLIDENLWLYNLGMIFTFLFYIIYYYKMVDSLKHKFYLRIIFIIYVILSAIDILIHWNEITVSYLSYSRIIGSLLLFVCAIFYLNEVFNSNKILNFFKTLPFWITIGSLIFYLTTIPIVIYSSKLNFSHTVYIMILVLSNYFLYGCFIAGFIINAYQQGKNGQV